LNIDTINILEKYIGGSLQGYPMEKCGMPEGAKVAVFPKKPPLLFFDVARVGGHHL
jgi:hypothetical protein